MERLSLLARPSASWPGAELGLAAGGGGWGDAAAPHAGAGPMSPPGCGPLSPMSPHYLGGHAL